MKRKRRRRLLKLVSFWPPYLGAGIRVTRIAEDLRTYEVWDKAASIRFRRPGRGTVTARFHVAEEEIEAIHREADEKGKTEPRFTGGRRRGPARAHALAVLGLLLAGPACGPAAAQQVTGPAPSFLAIPRGWEQAGNATDGYELRLDPAGGPDRSSCVLIRGDESAAGFLGVMQSVEAAPFRGRRWRLAARVRHQGVTGEAGLFIRIDDRHRQWLAFDNMSSRPIRGSGGWRRHEVILDVAEEAAVVAFGVFLAGPGTLRVDDFSLEPVDAEVPVTGSSRSAPPPPSPPEPEAAPPAGSDWLLGGTTPGQYRVELQPTGGRHGTAAASLRSIVLRPTGFVSLMRWIDARPHRGERLRLAAWVKAESVTGWAGLWLRVDGPGSRRTLAFDNMRQRPIRGTSDWRRYEVVLDVSSAAERIYYGALLTGPGGIRVDDFSLEPVERDVPVTDLVALDEKRPVNLDFDSPPASTGPER